MCVQSLLRWKRHEADPSFGPGSRFSDLFIALLLFDFYTKVLKRDAVRAIRLRRRVIKQHERSVMELLLQDALRSTNCIFPQWLDLISAFSLLLEKNK